MLRSGESNTTLAVALDMDAQRRRTILLWTGAILLAAMFFMSGSSKLANESTPAGNWDDQFVAWGYPAWVRFIVGSAEILSAAALLVPRVRFHGAAALTALMFGGIITHLANAEWTAALFPAVLGTVAGLVAWNTRPTWANELLHRLRVGNAPGDT